MVGRKSKLFRIVLIGLLIVCVAAFLAGYAASCNNEPVRPTDTPYPPITPSAGPTVETPPPTLTPIPTDTSTPTSTSLPTDTSTPTRTSTSTPTPTPTPTSEPTLVPPLPDTGGAGNLGMAALLAPALVVAGICTLIAAYVTATRRYRLEEGKEGKSE